MKKKNNPKIIDLDLAEVNAITKELRAENPVFIRGLGILVMQKVKGRKAVHNFSKKTITFKSYNRIIFLPLPLIKEVINQKKPLKTRVK